MISFHTLIATLFAEFSNFVHLKIPTEIFEIKQPKKFCLYNEFKNNQNLEPRAAVEDYYHIFRHFPP